MSDNNQLNISITASSNGVAPAAAQATTAINSVTQAVTAQSSVIAKGTQSVGQLTSAMGSVSSVSASSAGAMAGVGSAAVSAGHGTAGFARELIVLAHEMSMGNYNRFGGSLMVLAERSGQLSNAMRLLSAVANPVGAAIAAAAVVVGVLGVRALETADYLTTLKTAMDGAGTGFLYSKEQVEAAILGLTEYGHSSKDAKEAVSELSSSVRASSGSLSEAYAILPGLSAGMGSTASAAKLLREAIDDPASALNDLRSKLEETNPNLLRTADGFIRTGETAQATKAILDYLRDSTKSLADEGVTPLQGTLMALWAILAGNLPNAIQKTEDAFRSLKTLIGGISVGDMFKNMSDGNLISYLDSVSEKQKQIAASQAASQAASTAAAQATADKERELNVETAKGDELTTHMKVETSEIAQWQDKLLTAQRALNAAKAQGDTGRQAEQTTNIAEIQQKITEIKDKAEKESERLQDEEANKVRATQNDILESNRSTGQELLAIKRQEIDDRFKMGQISEFQEIQLLEQNANQQFAIEQKALQDQLAIWNQTPAERQKILNQLTVLEEKHRADILAIQTQAYQDEHKAENKDLTQSASDWKSYANTIGSTLKSTFSSILQGTLNWKTEMSKLLGNLAGTIFDKQVDAMVAKWFSGQAQQTGATIAGNAARQAANTSAAAAGAAAQATTGEITIQQDAAKAASGAYSAIVGIPLVGPALAPVAAGVAYTAVMGYENMASFDVGSWNLPSDMVAQVHQGEMIIPRTFADDLRSNGGLAGGGGGGDSFHIHAIDTKGMSRFIMQNSDAIAASMRKAGRNGNRNLNG